MFRAKYACFLGGALLAVLNRTASAFLTVEDSLQLAAGFLNLTFWSVSAAAIGEDTASTARAVSF